MFSIMLIAMVALNFGPHLNYLGRSCLLGDDHFERVRSCSLTHLLIIDRDGRYLFSMTVENATSVG